jgi:hypothetical protein
MTFGIIGSIGLRPASLKKDRFREIEIVPPERGAELGFDAALALMDVFSPGKPVARGEAVHLSGGAPKRSQALTSRS